MSFVRIFNSVPKLNIFNTNNARSIYTNSTPLLFQVTNNLFAEPLKKKKRLDPAIIRQREERKKRKIEKRIRRLMKLAKQLKPISEMEIPLSIKDQLAQRNRNSSPLDKTELEQRIMLEKEWCKYMSEQHKQEESILNSILNSQKKALEELKEESLELWMSAISIDPTFLPHEKKGPVHTPPIKNYLRDGEYIDITKKFEGE